MACLTCNRAKVLINKVSNIAQAYTNLIVINSPEVEEEAKRRILICTPCSNKVPLIKVGKITFFKCNGCGCPLEALIRSPDKRDCKLGKW